MTDRPNPNIIQNPLDASLQDIRDIEQNSPSVLEAETLPGVEPEREQEPLETQYVSPKALIVTKQLQQPIKPQCSKSTDAPVSPGGFVSPNQFRQPLKALPRTNKRKRKPGHSLIATDTPEKENIRIQRLEVKKKKLPKKNKANEPKKKAVRKVLQSESEDDTENISIHDEDSDWCEENEDSDWCEEDEVGNKIEILTDEKLLLNVLPRLPKEEDYVLVRFSTKRKSVYFVGKVLHDRNDKLEYFVSFLRANRKYQFHMPSNPDLSYVKEYDVKFILPKPCLGGSTLRQQSYYYFNVDFSQIDIR